MALNYGKQFEQKFKEDWLKLSDSDILRLYDTTNGYKSISNISDFICFKSPYMFYMECKSTQGNTFPFSRLTQFDKLSKKINIKGVNAGVIIWFIDHDKVCYVSVEEIIRLKQLNYKSIHVKMIDNTEFKVYNVPSKKKRVFLDSDYNILISIADSKFNSV